MDFLVIAKSSVRAVSIEFISYVDAKGEDKNRIFERLQPIISEYLNPKEDFESFGTIYLQQKNVTSRFISSIRKTGVRATLSYIEDITYQPYGSKARKTKKRTPKPFGELHCNTGETIIIEFLYPKNIARLLKKIDEAAIVDYSEENPELDRLVEEVKDTERALFAIYEPLIKKYDLGYNEVSYANNLTFQYLFCDKKFSKGLYTEVAKLLPSGYGVRVNQSIHYYCDI